MQLARRRLHAAMFWSVLALTLSVLALPVPQPAGAQSDGLATQAPTARVGSATWIEVRAPFSGDPNGNSSTLFEYATSPAGPWTVSGDCAGVTGEVAWRACYVSALSPDTSYYVRVTANDSDGVSGTNPQVIGPLRTAATTEAATTTATATATVMETYILVEAPITGDANRDAQLRVEVAPGPSGPWTQKCGPEVHTLVKRCRLHGLTNGSSYHIRVTATDPDGVSGSNPQILGPVRYTGKTNLALGKSISADSGWGCCANPAELVDGRIMNPSWPYGFAWTGGTAGWGGGAAGWKQATIDLGAVQQVARLDFWPHDPSNVPLTWRVEVSADGAAFSQVFATSAAQCRGTSEEFFLGWSNPTCGQRATFPATAARYVRYSFDDNTLHRGLHGWGVEIELFGPEPFDNGEPGGEWRELAHSGGPAPRYSFGQAYDAANDRLIVFSGEDAGGLPRPQDTWVLSNASGAAGAPAWTLLTTSGTPPLGMVANTVVYDPASNSIIAHAGCTGNCSPARRDVWRLSDANGLGGAPTWTRLPDAPVGRTLHSAVYDAAGDRMIVFGGDRAFPNTYLNDVWVLRNTRGVGGDPVWEQLTPEGTPPTPRAFHSAIYDAATNRMIVFGGGDPGLRNDVWALTNANGLGGAPRWEQLAPEGAPPPARVGHSAVYDATTNRMLVFGGSNGSGSFLDDTWALINANGVGGTPRWVELQTTGGPPPARFWHTAAFAPAHNRMLVLMGRDDQPGAAIRGDLWVLGEAGGGAQPFSVSGAIADAEGGPLAGVNVACGERSAMTDDDGRYTVSDIPAGACTLVPALEDYTFTPPSRSVSGPPDQSGLDFTGAPLGDDLLADGLGFWLDPPAIHESRPGSGVGLTVRRVGGKATVTQVAVDFYVGPPASGALIGRGTIPLIGPRSSVNTPRVSWAPSRGRYTLYAVIDPENRVLESDEGNNVISRTVTVLPPFPDRTAPRVDSFMINGGAASTRQRMVRLDARASDNIGGEEGVAHLLYIEYEFIQSIGGWAPARSSGWLEYDQARASYPWDLLPSAGTHYIQAWGADGAGNVSLAPFAQSITYVPARSSLARGQAQVFRQRLSEGQSLLVRLSPTRGDADLYAWAPGSPGNGEPPYVSNLSGGATDELLITAPRDGEYQIEVYGYTSAEYSLELVPGSAQGQAVAAASPTLAGGLDPSKPLRARPAVDLTSGPNAPPVAVPTPPITNVYLPAVRR